MSDVIVILERHMEWHSAPAGREKAAAWDALMDVMDPRLVDPRAIDSALWRARRQLPNGPIDPVAEKGNDRDV